MAAAPELVLFDVNETLTDMSPVRARLVEVGASGALFDTWFAAVLRDGFALAAAGGYAEFADIGRHQLVELLAARPDGPHDPEVAAGQVLAVLPELDLHADVPDGLRRLHDAGVRLATLTNGATAMTEGAFRRAGVLELFETRLSVADAGVWKPAPDSYLFATDRLGVEPGRAALVAVHPWDVDGAVRAGLRAGHLDRSGRGMPGYFTAPTVSAVTLPELADRLLGR
jgi:2-haloacid dehalogenase